MKTKNTNDGNKNRFGIVPLNYIIDTYTFNPSRNYISRK